MIDFELDNEKRPEQEGKPPRIPKEIEDLLRRVDLLAALDPRPMDEILGYGDDAVPR